MTRERIVGFLLGISIGTVVGYYLRPSEAGRPQNPRRRVDAAERAAAEGSARRIEEPAHASRGITWAGSSS